MKFLFSILPAICFFLTYKFTNNDLIYATIAILVSTVICFSLSYIKYKTISRFQLVLLVVLLIFAIPTIIIQDTDFIKWKVSVVNIMIALGLIICQFVFKKDVVEALSGIKTPIPVNVFKKATIVTALFLCACAGLNYVLAFHLPDIITMTDKEAENIWVNYKTYGNGIINFIFSICLFMYVEKLLSPEQRKELEDFVTNLKNEKIKE